MRVNRYVWPRAVFTAFGGFMYGYDVGATSGVKEMEGFRETIGISRKNGSLCDDDDDVMASALVGLLIAVLSIGAIFGALLAGALSDFAGRKLALMTGALMYAVGGVLQAGAHFLWMIFLGRSIGGIGIGILFMVVPLYIAEIAPRKIRGRLIQLQGVTLTLGVETGYIMNLVVQQATFGWRISLGVEALAGLVLATGMLFLPETPRWLVKKHKVQKAEKVLTNIHQSDEVIAQKELKDIQESLERVERSKESLWTLVQLLFKWSNSQRVIIGMCLQFIARLMGITLISVYAVTIYCRIGLPPFIATVVQGIVNISSTLVAIPLPDRFGRKSLLLVSALGTIVAMVGAATTLLVFRVEEEGDKVAGGFVVVFIFVYIWFYSGNFGSVPFIVTSEIFPLKIRGIAISLSAAAFWVGNVVLAFGGPVLLDTLQTYGTFYLLAVFQLMGFLFVLFTLPETKGIGLEDMDELFSRPWLERTDILYYLRCGCFWRRKKKFIVAADDSKENVDKQQSSTDQFEAVKVTESVHSPLYERAGSVVFVSTV